MSRNAISLFCSSGIGDLGLKANDIETVAACELVSERAALFQANNQNCRVFCGDIWKMQDEIINYYKSKFAEAPFLILATPPCQGMSSNGMGTMLRNYRKGIRPKFDERNRLIIPTLNIIKKLRPLWVIFENVPNMGNTYILDDNENLVNVLDFIHAQLGKDYTGGAQVIDVADYGVPQHRKRMITVFSRNPKAIKHFVKTSTYIPKPTHSQRDTIFTSHWVTLRECIESLPPLSSKRGENCDKDNKLHKVPLLDDTKLFWISHTPEGQTAFSNQCINPSCLYQHNRIHGAKHDEDGINRANCDTPLYCEKCGELLPRPFVVDKETGAKRIMKGFTSAYKRMNWDEPSSTLTQNFQYACSDNKIHPSQDRVLSLYEGLIIQTITNYKYSFEVNGKLVNDGLIRDTIGESIPPLVMDKICRKIIELSK